MKRKLIIIASLLVAVSAIAQEFRFVYIRLDNSMDKTLLKLEIDKLMQEVNNDNFALYYSNEKVVMDSSNFDMNELVGLISNQSSSIALSVADEFETLSNLLEQYVALDIVKDEFQKNKIVSNHNYSSISLDCFVGDDFFNNENQNNLIARLLFANSLNGKNFNLEYFYYPCGASYGRNDVQFHPKYSIIKQPNIIN